MQEIKKQNCRSCGRDSDTKIVCDPCRIDLTKSQRIKMDRLFQMEIIEIFDKTCVGCGHTAETESGELCAAHIYSKAAKPELRYDLSDALCKCMSCHQKEEEPVKKEIDKKKMPKATQEKKSKHKKANICKHPGCPIYGIYSDGKCFRHSSKL